MQAWCGQHWRKRCGFSEVEHVHINYCIVFWCQYSEFTFTLSSLMLFYIIHTFYTHYVHICALCLSSLCKLCQSCDLGRFGSSGAAEEQGPPRAVEGSGATILGMDSPKWWRRTPLNINILNNGCFRRFVCLYIYIYYFLGIFLNIGCFHGMGRGGWCSSLMDSIAHDVS